MLRGGGGGWGVHVGCKRGSMGMRGSRGVGTMRCGGVREGWGFFIFFWGGGLDTGGMVGGGGGLDTRGMVGGYEGGWWWGDRSREGV